MKSACGRLDGFCFTLRRAFSFHQRPPEPQWWITGFNPDTVGEADVSKQVMISSVKLSQFAVSEDKNIVYDKLKKETINDREKSQYVIFDDSEDTVWIMWYGESSL